MKPKCFKEADLPKQRLASNAIWEQRNIQEDVIEDLERFVAKSLYSIIAWNVSFSIGNSHKPDIRASILHRQLAGRGTLRNAPVKVKFCPINTQAIFLETQIERFAKKPDSIKLIRYRCGYYPACDCAPQLRLKPKNEARTLIHRAKVSLSY